MDILSMDAQTLMLFSELVKLAQEATEAESIIKCSFNNAFDLEKSAIQIYYKEDSSNHYIKATVHSTWLIVFESNYDGMHNCEFYCNANSIYKIFRAYFLEKSGKRELISLNELLYYRFAPFIRDLILVLKAS